MQTRDIRTIVSSGIKHDRIKLSALDNQSRGIRSPAFLNEVFYILYFPTLKYLQRVCIPGYHAVIVFNYY